MPLVSLLEPSPSDGSRITFDRLDVAAVRGKLSTSLLLSFLKGTSV